MVVVELQQLEKKLAVKKYLQIKKSLFQSDFY